jgi:hypothetical protein
MGPLQRRAPSRGETNVNDIVLLPALGWKLMAPGRMIRAPSRNRSPTGARLNTPLNVSEIGPFAEIKNADGLCPEHALPPTKQPPDGISSSAHVLLVV